MIATRFLTTIAFVIATLIGAAAPAQVTIELRPRATLTAGEPVRLGQVAFISPAGPEADRLRNITLPAPTTSTLTRDAVKAALDTTSPPVSWARTILRGGDIDITIASARTPTAPTPAAPSATPSATSGFLTAPAAPLGQTVGALILRAVADAAGVEPTTQAVTIRSDAPAEAQLLAQPAPASWKSRIQILGSTPTGRTTLRIEAFDGDRIALARTLTIDALIQRDILTVAALGGLSREQVITADDLRLESRTLTVSESARLANATPDMLIGTAAKRRIDQGHPIGPDDVAALKTAIIVKRGDDVAISCIAGGIVIKSKARAMSTGRDGELVTFQAEGSRKTFTARMNGPGHAVMTLDSTGN